MRVGWQIHVLHVDPNILFLFLRHSCKAPLIHCSSHTIRSNLTLPRGLPDAGVVWLLFLLLRLFLHLVGFLQGELAEALGEGHASGSGGVSDGQSDHVLSHQLRQLYTAKLPLQLTGQLREHIRSSWNYPSGVGATQKATVAVKQKTAPAGKWTPVNTFLSKGQQLPWVTIKLIVWRKWRTELLFFFKQKTRTTSCLLKRQIMRKNLNDWQRGKSKTGKESYQAQQHHLDSVRGLWV